MFVYQPEVDNNPSGKNVTTSLSLDLLFLASLNWSKLLRKNRKNRENVRGSSRFLRFLGSSSEKVICM